MDNEEKIVQQSENEEGMSLKDLFFIIKKHLLAIIIIVVAFTGCGVVYSKLQAPVYKASASMIVSYEGTGTTNVAQDYQLSSYISNTYVAFIKEDAVLDKVSENVNIPTGIIRNNMSVTLATNTLLIKVTYTTNDPVVAKDVVNEIIQCAQDVADKKDENGDPVYKFLNSNLKVLSPAKDGTRVSSTVKNTAIFFVLGLVVAFLFVLIKELLDTSFKSNEEIERTLGIPVIAGIPDYEFDGDSKKGGK